MRRTSGFDGGEKPNQDGEIVGAETITACGVQVLSDKADLRPGGGELIFKKMALFFQIFLLLDLSVERLPRSYFLGFFFFSKFSWPSLCVVSVCFASPPEYK